ncbi:MAG: 5-(carboxyamino)imidazole ribonucleotide mutase [Thermodesulfobacteriota bacterium]
MNNPPLVGVVMGSSSDRQVMEECTNTLEKLAIPFEITVSSAHRSPEQTRNYAIQAQERGIEVIVAGAGWAAHLAGALASHTFLPIIGVPIDSSPLQGMDALLSTVQMPPGVPVATMAIGRGGAVNAAVFAAQILALKYPDIAKRLKKYRQNLNPASKGADD